MVTYMMTKEDKELVTKEAYNLGVSESDVIRQLIRTLKDKHKD